MLHLLLLNDFFPDSIDVQAVQTECESQIEALNAAMSTLEVCTNVIELVDSYTSTINKTLEMHGVDCEQRLQTGRLVLNGGNRYSLD